MKDKAVLITGGTKGIGLSSALYFAKAGARTYLSYKWGSDDYAPLFAEFENAGAIKPVLIQADVSNDEDTAALLAQVKEKETAIDYFISNVGFAQSPKNLDEYQKRSLYKTLDYSTWPLIEYTRQIKRVFGKYPDHVIGISSDGPSHYYKGYDFVAASKALLEFFGKYLSVHLQKEGSRVNVIRFGPVKTESFMYIFGESFFDFVRQRGIPEETILNPDECGKAVFGLCSGLFDAMNGQIVTVDKGYPFQDNIMTQYLTWKETQNKE